MGNIFGFLQNKREEASSRPVEERIQNYKEFKTYLPETKLKEQGARCMDCGIPYCHAMGCPVYNLIPEWNDLVYKGKWYEALKRLEATNPLPEITGRICPAPCEASCTLSINDSPVTIKQIELAIIEKGFKEGWIKPEPPQYETGKRIAIVGSGPSGLAAATYLRRYGHQVTVFEKSLKIGGILRYGIPDFKLEKSILDRRIEQCVQEGIRFETDVVIGEDISVRYLKKSFDVILLTLGAGHPRDLNVPGRGFENIFFAMEYLTLSNKLVAGEVDKYNIISAKNKRVLVIGGGDTGSDCIGTARRQGAKEIYQFEIMPQPREWKEDYNPDWPNWPSILRTSSSQEEGVERRWSVATKKFSGRGVRVERAECCRVEWETDKNGRPVKMKEIPGSEFTQHVDLVLLAMGFVHVEQGKLLTDLGVEFNKQGNILVNDKYATKIPGIFAAGDATTGASLVVRALYHGLQAGKAINTYLGT